MSKIAARLLPLLLLCHLFPNNVGAQQSTPGLNLGDAVVTGFTGTIALDPGKPRPANKSAIDLTFINPDGPAARIVGVNRPGYVWDGRLFQAPKPFDVFAKDTGQVFGVALDDQPAPNIYLAATSAFGLNLVGRGADGSPERRKVGGPGAGWMKGQFGLDLQGDPGSIYKVDGTTGVVSLFAKVMLDGVPNPGPALGNLAYDAAHKQLLVSDLYTGMIHRFAVADGSEPGAPYNHGVTGRGAAKLAPLPFTPANRPNIANNKFNAENPDSWGFAPPERRVWGLAVQAGRLFYSVRNGAAAEGPQIWSVGIAQDGSFGADARLEVEVAAQPGPYPVSDIAFSQKGAMVLAQRAPIAASYDYSAFTRPGEPRLLRYWLKDANDPPSPGLWKPMPEEYAVGFAGSYRNTNGGVALGYGYRQDGTLDGASCEASLWTTAQNLRNNPALRSQLEPGGPLLVNGLQGSPPDMVRGANEPPAISYFIDYDDKFDDARASGHVGGVRILVAPCAGSVAAAGSSSTGSPPYVSGPQTSTNPPPPPPPGPRYDLSIKKTAGKVTFDPKTMTWTVTFTVVVTNNGAPFSPGNTISINDPVPSGMTFTSATGAGWTCSGSLNCGYAFGPGVFNTGATLVPLVITATSKKPGSYTNCADVAASGLPETTYANNRDCMTVDFKYPPNRILVEKVNLDPSCTVELLCRFQIKVTNLDAWPFNGPVTIADNTTIPMNIAFTDVPCTTPPPTSIPFSCPTVLSIPASGTLTFTVNGVIPAGSVPITGVHPDPINCAEISQPPAGTTIVVPKDCKPYKVPCGFACHMTDPQIAQIKIVKNADAAQCSPGGLCSYTFTISNVSNTTATGVMPITFIDTMPAGATNYVSVTPAPWGCVPFGAGQIKCLHPPGSIPAGGQLTVTVTFQISPSYNQPILTNCSEFFVGQVANASVKKRVEAAMDANSMRDYLQSRGISALSSSMPVLNPDDKSCTTVNIVTPVSIKACPPGSVQVGKECVKQTTCPPPMVPGPIAGQCKCPTGTVQKGKECVRPIECRSPLIPNASGTACGCPAGLEQRGRECVKPIVCNPPAKLNRRGACECPTDMVARGNSCIERERPRPQISPGDIIRNIPGGGRDEPRGGRDTESPRGGGQGPTDFPGKR